MCSGAALAVVVSFLLLSVGVLTSEGSLLPLLDRLLAGPAAPDGLADPFRILEHVPFRLDRDDVALVSPVRVDWKETPTSHLIMIDVPGMKREELKIEVEENRVLRVSGERKGEEEKKGEHWHCVERARGRFWRQFRLPDNADLDKVDARLADGVLTVSLPKLAPDQVKGPKVVSIGSGDEGDQKEKLLGGGGGETRKVEL
ncbi:22.0 kDa class IV heat shock protein-like [Iris pallida]|uniref:22.0 kDa class IV heat shock protein-like n=1 Tax=Iris pallida TaxID=29817 RepID=A0AAX6FY63_IRIPA|nr:22.0 kDa class IV heat shock protein-like [Iris pallida]